MEFNEKLILLRRENHLTQAQLAANLGVTRQTVYKWETGQSYPEAMTLFAMRNLFRVSIDCLLDNTASLPETRELISKSRAKENPEEAPKKAEIVESKEEAQEETAAEDESDASSEPQKKKKNLFSRLLGR